MRMREAIRLTLASTALCLSLGALAAMVSPVQHVAVTKSYTLQTTGTKVGDLLKAGTVWGRLNAGIVWGRPNAGISWGRFNVSTWGRSRGWF